MKNIGIFADKLFATTLSVALATKPLVVEVIENEEFLTFFRRCREKQVKVVVIQASIVSERDLEFHLGARSHGDFRSIIVTHPGAEKPTSFDDAVTTDQGFSVLQMAIESQLATFGPLIIRERGRPRMQTHGFELSAREYEAASLIAKGFTNQKIAETMELKDQTVKNLVSTIIRKLHCENRVQVALRLARSSDE